MADKDDAHHEFNPKHRIIGAIVIVALVVIFVPMILNQRETPPDTRPASAPTASGEIADTADTKVVVTPVAPEAGKPAESGEAAMNPAAPAPESAPPPETKPVAPVEQPPEVKKPPAAPTHEKTAKVSAAKKITKGWIVQVGTFTNRENAIHLRSKLKSHGHAVNTETVTVAGKKALRLRVGPFRDKEQAAKVVAQIHRETGVRGVVQTYP